MQSDTGETFDFDRQLRRIDLSWFFRASIGHYRAKISIVSWSRHKR